MHTITKAKEQSLLTELGDGLPDKLFENFRLIFGQAFSVLTNSVCGKHEKYRNWQNQYQIRISSHGQFNQSERANKKAYCAKTEVNEHKHGPDCRPRANVPGNQSFIGIVFVRFNPEVELRRPIVLFFPNNV